jgi:hypothetical protein
MNGLDLIVCAWVPAACGAAASDGQGIAGLAGEGDLR